MIRSDMFRAKYPRLLLNEIKWRFDLARCRVYYVHRGAPGNMKIVEGKEIRDIERGFLTLKGDAQDVHIPYHRIFRIDFDDHILFEREIKPLPRKKRL